jgi:hypothetical protein
VVQEEDYEPFEIELWVEKEVEGEDDFLVDVLDALEGKLEELLTEKMEEYLQRTRED